MKTIFTRAVVFSVLGGTALAGPDPTTVESDWARLDREIGELSTALRPQGSGGTRVGGLVRAFYARSADDAFEFQNADNNAVIKAGNDSQLGGFVLKDVDVYAEGTVGEEFDWRVSFDLDRTTDAWLEDAYVRSTIYDPFQVTIGSFKAPTTRSAAIDPENQVLPDRSILGQILDFWDPGVMVSAGCDMGGGFISAQNGSDGIQDHYIFAARGEFHLNGGAARRVEGAFGADSDFAATVGAFWFQDEDSFGLTGHGRGLDFAATAGPVSFAAEFAEIDGELLSDGTDSKISGGGGTLGADFFGRTLIPLNYAEQGSGFEDHRPYSLTGSYLIDPCQVEVVSRFEVYDDPGSTKAVTVGANWYRQGRNAFWHAGITQISSNEPGGNNTLINLPGEGIGDATLFKVGVSVGRTTSDV